jgi:hypothetical protein
MAELAATPDHWLPGFNWCNAFASRLELVFADFDQKSLVVVFVQKLGI